MATQIPDLDQKEISKQNKKMSPHYYNPHIIYVNTGVATTEQLINSIKLSLKNVSVDLKRQVTTKFKVNIIVDRSGKNYGYGYVWFTNTEVYYMLIGKNPDGSERVEWREDLNWVPPVEPRPIRSLEEELAKNKGKSWCDIIEEEEEEEAKYTRPVKKVILPPLMVLPDYQLDDNQKEIYRIQQEALARQNGTWKEDLKIEVPDYLKFEVGPARVGEVDDKFVHNILCGRNIPIWISEKDLKDVFSPYASDTKTKVKRKVNGETVMDTYPFVTINNKRIAFITYDPKTRDAQFALMMTRKFDFTKGDKTCMLIFNQSFKTS